MGFRARQIAALTVTATTVAVATGVVNAILLVRLQVLDAESRALLLARTFHHLTRQTIRQQPEGEPRRGIADDPVLRQYADGVVGYSPITLYVAIRDPDGLAIFHSDPNQQGRRLAEAETISAFSKRDALSEIRILLGGNRVLVADVPLTGEGERPLGSVVVAVSTLLLRSQFLGSVATSALVAGAVALVAFLASFLVANWLLAPLDRLRTELARIDPGEGRPPLDLRTEADVGRLVEFFATLSDRVAGPRDGAHGPGWVRSMLDGLADAVVVFNAEYRVLAVNDDACRLLRGSREQIEGKHLRELVPEHHPLRSLVDEALGRHESIRSRTVPFSVKGREVPYLLAAHVLREGSRVRGVMVTARNVDRLTRLGSQLSYSRQLAALGRLTSNVAHEIRNPLNALVIQTSLVRSKLKTRPEDAKPHLDILDEEIKRLDRVIDGFLKFTRPEEIALEPVQLGNVVRGALALQTARAEGSGIRVEVSVPEDLPPVQGDEGLLRQALLNLIENACDAMQQGGELRVRAAPAGEGAVQLTVEDTGVGIDTEHLPRVFELFYTTKGKGNGIGLSLVYRIVQLHGGEIRVESERGIGTRIAITLPEVTV